VSTGSAYSAFDKLQGSSNYTQWKKDMRGVLRTLRQWDVVTGAITAPVPADVNNPMAAETATSKAFEVRHVSAFMEISLRLSPSIKNMLDDDEKRFGAKQQGLQSMLMTKVQLAKWDGTGTIMGH
jgi:hypothetical protein